MLAADFSCKYPCWIGLTGARLRLCQSGRSTCCQEAAVCPDEVLGSAVPSARVRMGGWCGHPAPGAGALSSTVRRASRPGHFTYSDSVTLASHSPLPGVSYRLQKEERCRAQPCQSLSLARGGSSNTDPVFIYNLAILFIRDFLH